MYLRWSQPISRAARVGLLCAIAFATACGDDNDGGGGQPFTVTNLVSNRAGQAPVTDAHLLNAWGVARTANGPWWVANAHSGTSTVYDGNGAPFPTGSPLVVTIPAPDDDEEGEPTGTVANATPNFVLTNGTMSAPAVFLFATENGTIAGWNLNSGTEAQIVVDNSGEEAIYKGLAVASEGGANRLYATNFHAGSVDVFDGGFGPVVHDGAFTDPNIPDGYAPFGIQNIGGNLYVTYAKQDADKEDDVAGAGNGYVDVYDGAGVLLRRFASRGNLNAPWGIAQAPASFGAFDNAVLIGNFGDGRINAFNPDTGAFEGQLKTMGGNAIAIEGLWGIAFGNGATAGSASALYFAAGPDDENDGLFGMITVGG